MIIDFKIKNFRSYKNETNFTLEANDLETNSRNIFIANNNLDENLELVKVALIYGPNASGKTSLIRALYELRRLILFKPNYDDDINLYDPFIFLNNNSKELLDSEFEINFIVSNIKYNYKVKVLKNAISEETLSEFTKEGLKKLFERLPGENIYQKGVIYENNEISEFDIFENQLILSRFNTEPHKIFNKIFAYFKSIEMLNINNEQHKLKLLKKLSSDLANKEYMVNKLSRIIQVADTKISKISIHKVPEEVLQLIEESDKQKIKNPYYILSHHEFHDLDGILVKQIPLVQESSGTQSLFLLGGLLIDVLENGKVLIVDELDTSLHPFITKLLVRIFQSEKLNPKNAQLIFTTHDVTLLDKDLIRLDQVWITQKNKDGESSIYSLQDFENLSEDSPLEKWYMAGKFGGLPNLKSIDALFDNIEGYESAI